MIDMKWPDAPPGTSSSHYLFLPHSIPPTDQFGSFCRLNPDELPPERSLEAKLVVLNEIRWWNNLTASWLRASLTAAGWPPLHQSKTNIVFRNPLSITHTIHHYKQLTGCDFPPSVSVLDQQLSGVQKKTSQGNVMYPSWRGRSQTDGRLKSSLKSLIRFLGSCL